ncbi:type II secretion system protein GspG [Anatilimnocola floriformis]|uniref:type II secretion system protein GspG n=1 Tax=Anatilimnocola floriformis TaxID=2948575 RepID=UPI0020C2E80B|nr:type II secretion system protein GspG [Anatilimnocola floriformis]
MNQRNNLGAIQRVGLSLMELVVVLAILAAMATAATVATDKFLAQRRFEKTQTGLDALRLAVLGRHETATEQAPSVTEGFVADLGRLPMAIGDDPALQGAELWLNPNNLQAYGLKQSTLDSEVWLACGWRGPYLRQPTGAVRYNDGWGRPFRMLSLDSGGAVVPAAAGQPITGVASFGADGTLGAAPTNTAAWNQDMSVLFHDPMTPAAQHSSVSIQVTVWQRDGYGELQVPVDPTNATAATSVEVRLFGPDGLGGLGVMQQVRTGPFTTEPPRVAFTNVPIGPKVLRAYWTETAGLRKTVPMPIELTRTGKTEWSLILPATISVPATPPSTP